MSEQRKPTESELNILEIEMENFRDGIRYAIKFLKKPERTIESLEEYLKFLENTHPRLLKKWREKVLSHE